METRNGRPAKFRMRLVIAAAVAAAVMLCAALVHDAIVPAEARPATAKRESVPAPTVAANVLIEALGTERSGITGQGLAARTTLQNVGTTTTRFLETGDRGYATLCKPTFQGAATTSSLFAWKIDVQVMTVTGDRTSLRVHWSRTRDEAGVPAVERDDTRTFTLGPTDSHVLDFVENQDASSPCASLLVRISAQPISPQPQRAVTAQVWTVDEDATGTMRQVHSKVTGMTGQSIPFQFRSLAFRPSGSQPGDASLKMDVSGEFQAVVSDEGFVDVSLSAVRRTSWGRAEIHGKGHVQFHTAVGETAALILPQPAGRLAPDPGAAGIDLDRTFIGHRMWLYVKVESVQ